MAVFQFETITPEQALAFRADRDILTFSTVSAAGLTVAFEAGVTRIISADRSVDLGATPDSVGAGRQLAVGNFQFADNSQLFLGSATVPDTFPTDFRANSAVYANGGSDAVTINTGTNILVQGNAGEDAITFNGNSSGTAFGGRDNDTITINTNAAVRVNGNLGEDIIDVVGNGRNFIQGGGDADTITITGSGANTVFGDNGNDIIVVETAAQGNNTISGGAGSDIISVSGGGNNDVNGNTGADRIVVDGAGRNTIGGGADNDGIAIGGAGSNSVNGNLGNDTIFVDGATGQNTISGGQGADNLIINSDARQLVFGDLGNDTIVLSGSGAHVVNGGQGTDVINAGGVSATNLFADPSSATPGANIGAQAAATGALRLDGGMGSDRIVGGDGADTLIGGMGADTLTGGDGADRFVFASGESALGTTSDLITDFTAADDVITFGGPAGTQENFRELAVNDANATFNSILTVANAQLGNGVNYVLIQADAAGVTFSAQAIDSAGVAAVDGSAGGSILFADTNGDGVADTAVRLTGVTADPASGFDFNNII